MNCRWPNRNSKKRWSSRMNRTFISNWGTFTPDRTMGHGRPTSWNSSSKRSSRDLLAIARWRCYRAEERNEAREELSDFKMIPSARKLADGLPDLFSQLNVIGFSRSRNDGRTEADLKAEGLAGDERAAGGLQHVEGSPVMGQPFDVKRHNWSAGLAGGHCRARSPRSVHVRLELALGVARWHTREN